MGYSPDSKLIESASAVSVLEKGSPWFINLAEGIIPNKDNPHFDIEKWIRNQIKNSNDKGASAVILYNTIEGSEDLRFNGKDKSEKAPLPVIYVTRKAMQQFLSDPEATYDFKIKVETERQIQNGSLMLLALLITVLQIQ
jgi:hypothetical protein